jgi:DNA helicase II / ATP-dependent DNA helicase PcrA
LTYGLQVVRAVEALELQEIHAAVTAGLKHLVVDEYQDVNPAQERLIQLLAKPLGGADLVVVGDDDQAIYQWRGSNVENIVTFDERYDGVRQFHLLTNRRSRPGIVDLANSFASTIPGRLAKVMDPQRTAEGPSIGLAVNYDDEQQEAEILAMTIQELAGQGVPYRSMAVLVRGRVAYEKILDAFAAHNVPVQPGGRTGLFQQDVAAVLGATYAWLSDVDWAAGRYIQREKIELDDLLATFSSMFALGAAARATLYNYLVSWKARVPAEDKDVDLIGELYELLSVIGAKEWDTDDQAVRNRLGTIARFTNVLADYETVTRRSRSDPNNVGEQVGGSARGEWYYRNLAILMVNYANGNYDDFDGEADAITDAVDLGTVHGAKGLEWPIVFLPSLTDGRFPSSKTGLPGDWLVPTDLFDANRYEGSDADERRLFYVALTRARDWISLSSHRRVKKQQRRPSPYLEHAIDHVTDQGLPLVTAGALGLHAPDMTLTYSELAAYMECPQSFLLRNRLGFMPPVAAELGYGHAVHHLMRTIAERAKAKGSLPSPREINQLLVTDFYLPFANKPAHKEMKERARALVFAYVRDHPGDLLRTWATERPFELYLDGVVVSGRADVIYDEHDGVVDNLAIVDYKTSTDGPVEPLQLQVYADAGRREGLNVGAAFVHDMGKAERHDVPVDAADIASAESTVLASVASLKLRDFTPKPELSKCRRCDVRLMCKAAKLS